jgi:hypothetical protein
MMNRTKRNWVERNESSVGLKSRSLKTDGESLFMNTGKGSFGFLRRCRTSLLFSRYGADMCQ